MNIVDFIVIAFAIICAIVWVCLMAYMLICLFLPAPKEKKEEPPKVSISHFTREEIENMFKDMDNKTKELFVTLWFFEKPMPAVELSMHTPFSAQRVISLAYRCSAIKSVKSKRGITYYYI